MKTMLSMLLAAGLVLGGVVLMGPAESGEVGHSTFAEYRREPIRIDSNASFPGNASYGDGSADNPWVIQNLTIDANGTHSGIYVGNVTDHFIIRNCTVYNASLEANGQPQNASIVLFNVTNALLMNNTANASANGIVIYNSTCEVVKNNVTGNANHGIVIYNSGCNVTSNNVTKNENTGIHIYNSTCNVTHNNISVNIDYGIRILNSSACLVTNNILSKNGIGLNVSDSENCHIYHNTFTDNDVQAENFPGSGTWDDGYPSGGNYWVDYDGPDLNYDGIGDSPYHFDHGMDRYPLMAPWTAPLDGDFEAPFALSSSPNGTAVDAHSKIIITWNETMNWTSVEAAFEYTDGNNTWGSADGDWEHDPVGNVSTFTPSEPFLYETHYVITVNSSASDIVGNMLDQNRSGTGGEWPADILQWSFTTDDEAPYVVSTQPADGQVNVDPFKTVIVIAFSEPMNRTSTEQAFSYTEGTETWNITSGSRYWNALRTELTFSPHAPLETNTTYTVTLGGELAKDVGGKGLKFGNHTWWFRTWLEPPAPKVLNTYPPDGASGVSVNTYINIIFDNEMDTQSVEGAFSYTDGTDTWTAADGTVDWYSDKTLLSFQPAERLNFDALYIVTVGAEAKSAYGVNLDGNGNGIPDEDDDFIFRFTTTPEPPTVVSHYPLANQRDVPTSLGAIYINFSKVMLINSISNAVSISPVTPFTAAFHGGGQNLTLIINEELRLATEYRVTVLGTAMDMSGTRLDGNGDGTPGDRFTFSFFTEGMDIPEPPKIIDVFPRANTTIPVESVYIQITFNVAMNRTSVQSAFSFRNGTEEVNGTFTWSNTGRSFRFTPAVILAYNTTYDVSLAGTAKDIENRVIGNATSWYYITEPEIKEKSLWDWVLYGVIIALLALCTILYMANRALRRDLKRTRVKLKRLKRGIKDEEPPAGMAKGTDGGEATDETLPEEGTETAKGPQVDEGETGTTE